MKMCKTTRVFPSLYGFCLETHSLCLDPQADNQDTQRLEDEQ